MVRSSSPARYRLESSHILLVRARGRGARSGTGAVSRRLALFLSPSARQRDRSEPRTPRYRTPIGIDLARARFGKGAADACIIAAIVAGEADPPIRRLRRIPENQIRTTRAPAGPGEGIRAVDGEARRGTQIHTNRRATESAHRSAGRGDGSITSRCQVSRAQWYATDRRAVRPRDYRADGRAVLLRGLLASGGPGDRRA